VKKLLWMSFLFLCFAFMSCATTKIVYDESVQENGYSYIMPSAEVGIDEFNGKKVQWHAGFFSATEVAIPSGEAELLLSLRHVQRGQFVYTGGAFVLPYYFEKGHNYFIMVMQIINEGEVVFIVQDKTAKTKTNVNAKAKRLFIM
jgi:hypothetical protein